MAQTNVQRRLSAILAADVVGYSRLVGNDEEGTIGRLQSLRTDSIDPSIQKFGGRIVKTMGDGLLIEFASVVDAVRAAVEIQRTISDLNDGWTEDQRIELRIGINLGDIVIEGEDILGDGVNVAARLENLAAPGGVCISDRVFASYQDLLTGSRHRAWNRCASATLRSSFCASDDVVAYGASQIFPAR